MLLAQIGGGAGGGWTTLIWMGAIFALMYFMLLRPQQKQAQQHRELLAALKKGDEVITQGGLMGKIHEVREKTLVLEIATGVKVRVLKGSVQGKGTVTDEAAAAEPKKEEK